MSVAILALTLLACIAGSQAQVAGNACTLANMTPWPVTGSYTQYYMCVDGTVRLMTCPTNSIFIANNANIFGCVPFSDVTCTYNPNNNYYYNNNNNNMYYGQNYGQNYVPNYPPNSIGNDGWTYSDYQNYLAGLRNGQYQNGWFPNGVDSNGNYQDGYYARKAAAAEKSVEKKN